MSRSEIDASTRRQTELVDGLSQWGRNVETAVTNYAVSLVTVSQAKPEKAEEAAAQANRMREYFLRELSGLDRRSRSLEAIRVALAPVVGSTDV